MKPLFEKALAGVRKVKEFFKKFFFLTAVNHQDKIQHVAPAVTTLSRLHFVIIFALLFFGSYQVLSQIDNAKKEGQTAAVHTIELAPLPENFYKDLYLEAKAAYVLDVKNDKVLFGKNEGSALPLASLTKVMTALVAAETLPKSTVVEVTLDSLLREGDSGLVAGEKWDLQDLTDFTLMISSNDGAAALAAAANSALTGNTEGSDLSAFVEKMNMTALDLGMKNTHFNNETGLDKDEHEAGAYGSAEDQAKLGAFIIKHRPNLLEATRYPALQVRSHEKTHSIVSTSSGIRGIPSLIGTKTGFTDLAGGNLLVVFDAGIGYPIVIVILGSTYEDRFTDAEKLAQATLAYLGGYKENSEEIAP